MNDTIKIFDSLYSSITEKLLDYTETQIVENEYKDWILYLIEGFLIRYKNWEVEQMKFMDLINSQKYKLTQLLGYANLHINYDLPIVLAKSFKGKSHHIIDTELFPLYEELTIPIQDAFLSKWDYKPIELGLNYEPYRNAIKVWLNTVRSTAWHNSKIIFNYPEDQKAELLEIFLNEQYIQFEESTKNLKSYINIPGKLIRIVADRILAPSKIGLISESILESLIKLFWEFSRLNYNTNKQIKTLEPIILKDET